MSPPSTFAILVLLATLGLALWGGFVLGPRRLVPFLLVLGPLFLPAFARLDLPGLPALTRTTAVTAPALVLLFFSPADCWRRFRWTWPDLFLLAWVAWTAVCVAHNQGGYAAGSMALAQTLTVAVPYLAGRLYLQRSADLVRLTRAIAPLALVYLALMAFEARMYPRFQQWVYGEDVIALSRFGLYRPIVFAENQLELGHMLALLTILMLAVHRAGGEVRKAAGRLLGFGIAAGTAGVLLSLSRGPILALALAWLLPKCLRRTGACAALLGAGGVLFFLWMLSSAGSSLVAASALADADSEAGETLFYRFLQIETWKPLVAQSPLFGWGESWAREQWDIIDGELLLTALGFGYPGLVLLSLFWLSFTWLAGQRTFPRRHAFQHFGAALAPMLGFLVFSAWGDSFLRVPHYFVVGGVLGVLAGVRSGAEEDSLAANPVRTVKLRYG